MRDDVVSSYVKRSEGMVRPAEVAIISLFGSMLGKLPVRAQKALMDSSMEKNPYMGFVVEPYPLFLCHEITDLEAAQAMVPEHYKIVPTRIFEDGEAKPYVIFGSFTVHTSAFWGSRVEMYVVAEDTRTGLLSWIIVDYDTNTLSFDPGQGFVDGNAETCVVTTTHRGTVVVDVSSTQSGRRIAATADLRQGIETPLDTRLWIEGNLSIDYGGHLDSGESTPFGIIFDPGEMERALRIPLEHTQVQELSWHPGLYDPVPSEVCVFPYAQHFVTTGVPMAIGLRTKDDLDRAVGEINAAPPSRGFESDAIKRSMLVGLVISSVLTWGSIGWIVVHLATAH